jgi:hypothetical protein
MKESTPLARTSDIVVLEVQDETLVYDLRISQAHCLNETAASVWKHCDGKNTASDISKLIGLEHNTLVSDDFVQLALDQLWERSLLADGVVKAPSASSRREMIKRVGMATVIAAPIVASILVPSSVHAAGSCSCGSPGACITQSMCPNTNNCNGSGICAP